MNARAWCVEDLAEELKLAVSTVSAHLKKLQQAGLAYPVKVQYYNVYHLKREILEKPLSELLPQQAETAPSRSKILRDKVLRVYFKDGKVERLPTQNKKRWIVYLEIIKLFEPGREYSEPEVNAVIRQVHEDHCFVRRELVEEGVLTRRDGVYRLVENYSEQPGFYQNIWRQSEGAQGN